MWLWKRWKKSISASAPTNSAAVLTTTSFEELPATSAEDFMRKFAADKETSKELGFQDANGNTALILAVQENNRNLAFSLMAYMLDKNVSPETFLDLKDREGHTALDYALDAMKRYCTSREQDAYKRAYHLTKQLILAGAAVTSAHQSAIDAYSDDWMNDIKVHMQKSMNNTLEAPGMILSGRTLPQPT